MSSFPSCRDCGNDLTTSEEQEEGLCIQCQVKSLQCQGEYLTKADIERWLLTVDENAKICPRCITVMLEVDGKPFCPVCESEKVIPT